MKALRFAAQLALYVPLMVLIGYFSSQPRFSAIAGDEALLRLSFIHAAELKEPCRRRSPEELAKRDPWKGLDAFTSHGNGMPLNWHNQGADAGLYSNDEIHAVRILAMEPTTDRIFVIVSVVMARSRSETS